jgi:hypothetical protein
MIRYRDSLNLFSLPLIILLLFWAVVRRKPVADEIDLQVKDALLDELYYALPVPENLIERWAVQVLIEWIYRERGALAALNSAGVRMVGFLRK